MCDDRTSLIVNTQSLGDIVVKICHRGRTAVVDFLAMILKRQSFVVITVVWCQAPLQNAVAWQGSPDRLRLAPTRAPLLTSSECQALTSGSACQAPTGAAQNQDPKPQLPKSQIPDLGRPTKPTDEQPLLNFGDYFIGKWNFEWDVPEGPLGTSGVIKGSVVFRQIGGSFFEATTTATGPDGPISIKEMIAYRAEGRTAARWITDSRGYSYSQIASVGGDLGGFFNLYFEGSPFVYKGKTVRIKNALRLTSPLRYMNTTSVSTDGGAFVNYGRAWFEKDPATK
jgi:hypothetical protein